MKLNTSRLEKAILLSKSLADNRLNEDENERTERVIFYQRIRHEEFTELLFSELIKKLWSMRIWSNKDYVVQNPKYMRPEELPYLRGDSTKARTILGWKPEYTFEQLMHEMVDHWMDILQGKISLR